MIEHSKRCCICKEVLSITCFSQNISKKDGRQCACKVCQKAYRQKNLDHRKQKDREYYQRNQRKIIERAVKYNRDNRVSHLLATIKYRSKAKGIPFSLTREDIVIPEYCPILGIKLNFASGKVRPDSPSVDQIVPGKGYTRDNIWVISHRANMIKNDATPGELIQIAEVLMKMFPHLANAPTEIQNKPSQETI